MRHAGATRDGVGPTKGPEATPRVSLSDLYDDLAARVYGIAAQVVGDDALAADISERVLLDLYRDATAGELDGDLHHLATRLTHRAAVFSLRYGTPPATATAGSEPDSSIRMVALLDRLPEAEHLSDVQRKRVALAFYGGRTYDEIARLSDVDPLDVSNDLRAGLRNLRS